jgi:4-diphosphocytidyl-2-C-methyl-D-erythritol kinase
VNLHLSVGPLRADGYHELVTVFHAVELFDEVLGTPQTGLSLSIQGDPDLPTDERNLAWRAAALLAETARRGPDVHLELRKAIPVAGGMAGGSADAAATLVACARLWDLDADLPALAARLGSDVAFPLLGGTAVGTGRGEILRPVPDHVRLHWVFAPAGFGIPAPAAYAGLDRLRATGLAPAPVGSPDPLLAALAAGDIPAVAAALANDLQPAALALRPEVGATLDAGVAAGALAGIVSGSGPTCAFLCADADSARAVAARLPGSHVGAGPVAGARVVA